MENLEKLAEFAPLIVIILLYIRQNNLFIKPEQLEKKHREILDDMKKNFVELNAYKEFQAHIYSKLDELNNGINELKSVIMKSGKEN